MARIRDIGIGMDTGDFEKGVRNGIIEPLENAEQGFEKLEKAAKSADIDREIDKAAKATDKLDDELDQTRKSLDKLSYAARDIGDGTESGMRKASDNVEEFKNEASQNFSEVTSSFTGDMDSAADLIQGTLGGLASGIAGPLGLALGAAAAGVGLLYNGLNEAKEKAAELALAASETASEAINAGQGVEQFVTGADRVAERIQELQTLGGKGFEFFWQDDPSILEEWTKALSQLGRPTEDIQRLLSGSTDAMQSYTDAIKDSRDAYRTEIDQLEVKATALVDQGKMLSDAEQNQLDYARAQASASETVIGYLDDELKARKDAEGAADEQRDAGIQAALDVAAAQEEAADAQQAVKDSVLDAYDQMRDAATEYATNEDGALDITRWLEYTQEHAAAVSTYQSNIQTMKLTPEQWSNLLEMPADQRAQWVAQFVALPADARDPYAAALNDLGSAGGDAAAVAFDTAFEPDADVQVKVETDAAASDLKALAGEKRTATIEVKTTGKAKAKSDIDALAKKRNSTITVKASTADATRTVDNWRRNQAARPLYITVRTINGGDQLV